MGFTQHGIMRINVVRHLNLFGVKPINPALMSHNILKNLVEQHQLLRQRPQLHQLRVQILLVIVIFLLYGE